jgi:hypothetical protein
MKNDVKPIRTKRDYESALQQVERLWGAKLGTPAGDRLDVLATLIDAYETAHYSIDPARSDRSHPLPHGAAGIAAQGSGAAHRHAHPGRRGAQPQAQIFPSA